MSDPRPDVPISLRDLAQMLGVQPRTLKARMQRRARHTGERLLFSLTPGGKLYTTIGACRGAFGDDFGRAPSDPERIATLERKVRELRRDQTTTAKQMAKIAKLVSILAETAKTSAARNSGPPA